MKPSLKIVGHRSEGKKDSRKKECSAMWKDDERSGIFLNALPYCTASAFVIGFGICFEIESGQSASIF